MAKTVQFILSQHLIIVHGRHHLKGTALRNLKFIFLHPTEIQCTLLLHVFREISMTFTIFVTGRKRFRKQVAITLGKKSKTGNPGSYF
jgi:hypothetical protein